ncbi:hypothetical protein GCM10018987_17890 [Streptomyces cremeus]
MRQVLSKGVLVTAAVSGVLSVTSGYAHADAVGDSTVANSPGVVSGNNVQAPVHVPVNLCGNTVTVIGLLNPAFGNKCANGSSAQPGRSSGAAASSTVTRSPGVVSGNNVQAPVHVPVNACGNTVNVVAALNPAFGNKCANGPTKTTPPVDEPPADQPPADEPPANEPPADEPPANEPPADEPPAYEPPASDEPPADQPPTDEPPADEPPASDEPPADQPPADEPPADEPPASDEPPTNEPPADEPPASDEPPADQPPADEPPASDEPPADEPPAHEPPASNEPPVTPPARPDEARQAHGSQARPRHVAPGAHRCR